MPAPDKVTQQIACEGPCLDPYLEQRFFTPLEFHAVFTFQALTLIHNLAGKISAITWIA